MWNSRKSLLSRVHDNINYHKTAVLGLSVSLKGIRRFDEIYLAFQPKSSKITTNLRWHTCCTSVSKPDVINCFQFNSWSGNLSQHTWPKVALCLDLSVFQYSTQNTKLGQLHLFLSTASRCRRGGYCIKDWRQLLLSPLPTHVTHLTNETDAKYNTPSTSHFTNYAHRTLTFSKHSYVIIGKCRLLAVKLCKRISNNACHICFSLLLLVKRICLDGHLWNSNQEFDIVVTQSVMSHHTSLRESKDRWKRCAFLKQLLHS
jgi:hypothetical protein